MKKKLFLLMLLSWVYGYSHPYATDRDHLDDKVRVKKKNDQVLAEVKFGDKSKFVDLKHPKDLVQLRDGKEGRPTWISKEALQGTVITGDESSQDLNAESDENLK